MKDLYPNTISYIKKLLTKDLDYSKIIKLISNKYCISERDAARWVSEVVGVGKRSIWNRLQTALHWM